MKVYIVYTMNGDEEVLFADEAFHSEKAAQKYINDTYIVPRRYDWDVKELEFKDWVNPIPNSLLCEFEDAFAKKFHPRK